MPASIAPSGDAADHLRSGLGGDLQDLYHWRRRADYASGPVSTEKALAEYYLDIARFLGVSD